MGGVAAKHVLICRTVCIRYRVIGTGGDYCAARAATREPDTQTGATSYHTWHVQTAWHQTGACSTACTKSSTNTNTSSINNATIRYFQRHAVDGYGKSYGVDER